MNNFIPPIKPGRCAGFDEEIEKNAVMVPLNARQWTLKEGVTRAQAERFFKRLDAVGAARAMPYPHSDVSVASLMDSWFEKGYCALERRGRYFYFINDETGDALRLSAKAEREYIMVLLDCGKFKRNF